MGDFAEDAIYSNYYRGEEDDSRENTSGAFDHEERAFLDAEHNKQMNELNRRMVEEFDKGDKSDQN